MKLTDTIAAISTPYGKGGVALIRISGDEALQIAEKIFFSRSGRALSSYPVGKLAYGEIRDKGGESVDDVMAVYFRAPASFSGEDTVEISCHGGVLVTSRVLGVVLSAGARSAEAGEFTRRAYINGKMRLSEAEALGNLLEAQSDTQLCLARGGMQGALADRLDGIYLELRNTLTSVYAAIDFPDEDLSEMSREEICASVEGAIDRINDLSRTYGTGRAITEGIATVICGRTNAGKSSVYNRLLGYEAAIVTDIEGTTRDCLRESVSLGRVMLRLCDTAGLRATEDTVESIGIERARQEIENAGLILAVFDASRPLTEEDIAIAEEIALRPVPSVALLNKADSEGLADMSYIEKHFKSTVLVSAKEGTGFDRLASVVEELFVDGSIDLRHDAVVTGARQYAALTSASEALTATLSDLKADLPLDLCCVTLESALTSLAEIDGRALGEEIVNEIFSKFCVGK